VIVLSLVLVIVAAVLLVLGVFQDGLLLIYLSIFSCLLAMGLLGIGVLLRRREVGSGAGAAASTAGAAASTAGSAASAVQGRGVAGPSGSTDLREDRGPDVHRTPAAGPSSPSDAAAGTATGSTSRKVAKQAVVKKATIRRDGDTAPPGATGSDPATSSDPTLSTGPTAPSDPTAASDPTASSLPSASSDPTASSDRGPEATSAGRPGATSAAGGADRLSDVKGLGPAKRRALLDRFGDEQRIREASIDELTEIRGIGPRLARAVKDALG
jgi:predicted flap endonuclease-1-like 5' DNA nuclease